MELEAKEPGSGPTSGCPSVMTVTPVAGGSTVRGSPVSRLPSTPACADNQTPAASASSYQKVAVKTETPASASLATPGMSQKKRLLAKAHSEWILSDPKSEPSDSSSASFESREKGRFPSESNLRYSSYEYLERDREADRAERYERERLEKEKERDRQEREQQERIRLELERRERDDRLARERGHRDQIERERLERERAAAEYDYHAQVAVMSARERDLRDQLAAGVVPRLELAPAPPLAHQPEYPSSAAHQLEYGVSIQPPAAHTNRDLLAVHRSAQHFATAHESRHSAAAHHAAAAAAGEPPAGLYAPATVYVTAAGYQQLAALPPPAHHHGRPVLPPPMQPAAVFQHPAAAAAQVAPYGYAPLSPGKTRYLY